MASWEKIAIVVLLAVQCYTCAALNKQETGWVSRHLKRPKGLETHTSRRLGDSTTTNSEEAVNLQVNGWRGTLIDTSSKAETTNYTILQKIHRDVEASKARAAFLDRRARNAPYHTRKGRRRMLDFTSDISTTPGSYSMELSIGTPPQKFLAIADTGSDLVWLQCSPCDICFNGTLFEPDLSSTYAPLGCGTACDALGSSQVTCTPNCQYTITYGDESTSEGDFSLETVTLTNTNGTTTTMTDFQFGCGRRNQGTFSGTDGLIGLARGPISFPSQIALSLNNVNKFSYCLLSRYDEDAVESPLIFGESAVPTNSTGVSYTPILTPYDVSLVPYYYVSLLDIVVGDAKQNIPASAFELDVNGNGGVVFDSGTTYTILNTEAYKLVTDSYAAGIGTVYTRVDMLDLTGLEVCYDVSTLETLSIPDLIFNFDDADFNLPFENIVILFTTDGVNTFMCLTLLESTGISIFGNFQQQNFQVLYDEDNLRIGWVEMDCKSL